MRAEESESEEQQEYGQHPDVEGPHTGAGVVQGADREQTSDADDIDRDPDVAAIARPEPGRDVAGEHQYAPQYHDLAVEIVHLRSPDALDDVVNVGERRSGLLAIDHGDRHRLGFRAHGSAPRH